jgi:hypothetical protein
VDLATVAIVALIAGLAGGAVGAALVGTVEAILRRGIARTRANQTWTVRSTHTYMPPRQGPES